MSSWRCRDGSVNDPCVLNEIIDGAWEVVRGTVPDVRCDERKILLAIFSNDMYTLRALDHQNVWIRDVGLEYLKWSALLMTKAV